MDGRCRTKLRPLPVRIRSRATRVASYPAKKMRVSHASRKSRSMGILKSWELMLRKQSDFLNRQAVFMAALRAALNDQLAVVPTHGDPKGLNCSVFMQRLKWFHFRGQVGLDIVHPGRAKRSRIGKAEPLITTAT